MKNVIQNILNSPKTTILGLLSAVGALLTYYKLITTQEAILWSGVAGALIGLFSKDADVSGKVK